MLFKLLIALSLMALCVVIHATGLTLAFRWLKLHATPAGQKIWPATRALIGIAGWAILLHLVQIVIWGLFYVWREGMPDLDSAFYFSAVTYTTTGYGDLVLPKEFRLIGGVEALTGILMCGLSTGMFFAAFSRVFRLSGEGNSAA
jgi:hypothetical protein